MQQDFFWTDQQLAHATKGRQLNPQAGGCLFSRVTTDSRDCDNQSLFIAICGERFDAHQFLQQVIDVKTVVLLISDEDAWNQLVQNSDLSKLPCAILVADTRLALADFAAWHRQQMPLKRLIAVTGSNGKTTNKTMLAQIFSAAGSTLATEGNLNNDFGVPRTLLQIRPEHDYAIIEMGANHPGEIRYLTQIAKPDITLITNVAGAHLEGFGSLQGVIDTKGEIIEGLDPELGTAIFNANTSGIEDWLSKSEQLGIQNISLFGMGEESKHSLAVSLSAVENTDNGVGFTLDINSENDCFSDQLLLPVVGEHNAMNAAACSLVALTAGIPWPQIKAALQVFSGVSGRLQKSQLRCGFLLDDSYNANPESIKAGLKTLASLSGCQIACLGAMAELGGYAEAAHLEVAEYAAQVGINALLVYGAGASQMPERFIACAQTDALVTAKAFDNHALLNEFLDELLNEWSNQTACQKIHLLVKGSRSSQMELIANHLREEWL